MWSDENYLHFRAQLQAWEGEALIFDRVTEHKVRRSFV